jgi:hypothetical protein
MKNAPSDFNWPGWPLDDNPFGQYFDLAARKRMIRGSRRAAPFLKKYKHRLGKVVLEVGPFFNPLVIPEELSGKVVFFWENDRHVLSWLSRNYKGKLVFPIFCDLNKIEGTSFLKLKLETLACFKKAGIKEPYFDSVVVSHVFNYIDYKLFLMVLKDFLKKGSLVFINNVVNYGLPAFFSEKRPKSIPEIIRTIKETGYEIIEKKVLESPDRKHQKNKRLIIVAKNK